jgi:hypothetical protein
MNKIKFVAALILTLVVVLALFSKHIAKQNSTNLNLLKTINEQKAFTQEISKNIFYIYKNKDASTKQLDKTIQLFIENMNNKEDTLDTIDDDALKEETKQIVLLWNDFYLLVQNFRDKNKMSNPYGGIILEEIVKDIYNKNLKLVTEFNKIIAMHKRYFDTIKERNRVIQIVLFVTILLLLLYLFTQLKDLILFIQKFLYTSKKIIQKSTVKGVEPIEIDPSLGDISEASGDFNYLIQKINNSMDVSLESVQRTSDSLEQVEENIEDLLELIAIMSDKNSLDKELIKKEDVMIEALEELSNILQKLQTVQKNLKNFKK